MAVACGGLFPAAATAQSYQLVTITSDLESGKRYLIVAESGGTYYAWSGFSMQGGTATPISVSNGTITSAGKAAPMQLVQSGEMWKIIDLSTEKYVGAVSSANSLEESSDFSSINSNRFLWYISFENENNRTRTLVQSNANESNYLKFNNKAGIIGTYFGIYGISNFKDISLYKEVLTSGSPLTLYNGIDNTAIIDAATGSTFDVTLKNRKLIMDGKWNTLCLPFSLTSLTGTPLDGATIMELDKDGNYKKVNDVWAKADDGTKKTGFDANSGTLYLFFETATSIVAGKPYIIKWDNASGTIDDPTFSNVTISNTTIDVPSQDGYVTFKGGYNVKPITGVDQSILFLGSGNNVYYPNAAMNINAFRAYFQLNNGLTAGESVEGGGGHVRAFTLSFGDSETTEITTTNLTNRTKSDGAWHTLDGRRIDGKPTKRGLYINNGKKVAIK